MKKEEKVVMYDTPGLVKQQPVQLWVGPDKRGYQEENMARYANCTHYRCECGQIYPKGYTKCADCRQVINDEKYDKLEFKAWDGKTPLALWDDDEYFFDLDHIIDFADTNDIQVSEMKLVICVPNELHTVNEEYWEDIMPEDRYLVDVAPELVAKLEELNQFISDHKPVSWYPGNLRTAITIIQS